MTVTTIYIEITNICNLNCTMCYNRSGLNTQKKELSCEQIIKIIELFLPFGLERVLLSGGEPTLHSEFTQILDLVDAYPKLSFGIATNGTTLCHELTKKLNTANNLFVQISLDGSNEKYNSKSRGVGNFEKTISLAKSIKRSHKKNALKMVITKENCEDVENFCNFAFSLDFIPEFAFIYKQGNAENNWENMYVTAKEKNAITKRIKKIADKYQKHINLPLCTYSCPLRSCDSQRSFCIKPDGSIQPCQFLYSSNFTIGNIHHFNEKELLKKLKNITYMANKRVQKDFNCSKCIVNPICGKGCMGIGYYMDNSPYANDGDCEYRKTIFIEDLKNKCKGE